jgi:molybdopterin synthase sulfur carrier subunit
VSGDRGGDLPGRAEHATSGSLRPAVAGPLAQVRVVLPAHLRTLAGAGDEITVRVEASLTVRSVLDAVERDFPVLRGTIREHLTQQRRPFLRFFACGQDLSHDGPDVTLPEAVATGHEPLLVIGAIAGG